MCVHRKSIQSQFSKSAGSLATSYWADFPGQFISSVKVIIISSQYKTRSNVWFEWFELRINNFELIDLLHYVWPFEGILKPWSKDQLGLWDEGSELTFCPHKPRMSSGEVQMGWIRILGVRWSGVVSGAGALFRRITITGRDERAGCPVMSWLPFPRAPRSFEIAANITFELGTTQWDTVATWIIE